MPIPMTCQCGKALKIPDAMAGKAVKCPGCQSVLRVPAGGPAASAPRPTPPRPSPAPTQASAGLEDLFDEEGFAKEVGRVCRNCSADLKQTDVLCTKCGFHAEDGVVMQGHETAGVDIDHGTLALRKAAVDMKKAKAMQDKLARGAGMPWWALALVLFMIVLAIVVGVLAVSASRQIDENSTFNPIAIFLQLSGFAFLAVSLGALAMIAADAFKKAWWKGLLTMFFGPFTLYYVCTNFKATWKFLLVNLFTGAIGGGMLSAGIGMMP